MVGSPTRVTIRRSAPLKSSRVPSARLTRRPVSSRPQVEALTSSDSLRPRCLRQFASPSLSRISLSVVVLSGMRSKASATHISNTPSSLDKSYWRMKDSTTLWSLARARTRVTSAAARSTTCSRSAGGRSAWSSRSLTVSVSSRSQAAVMRARAGVTWTGSSELSMVGVTDVSMSVGKGMRQTPDCTLETANFGGITGRDKALSSALHCLGAELSGPFARACDALIQVNGVRHSCPPRRRGLSFPRSMRAGSP